MAEDASWGDTSPADKAGSKTKIGTTSAEEQVKQSDTDIAADAETPEQTDTSGGDTKLVKIASGAQHFHATGVEDDSGETVALHSDTFTEIKAELVRDLQKLAAASGIKLQTKNAEAS
jgi:hypothetical protein